MSTYYKKNNNKNKKPKILIKLYVAREKKKIVEKSGEQMNEWMNEWYEWMKWMRWETQCDRLGDRGRVPSRKN